MSALTPKADINRRTREANDTPELRHSDGTGRVNWQRRYVDQRTRSIVIHNAKSRFPENLAQHQGIGPSWSDLPVPAVRRQHPESDGRRAVLADRGSTATVNVNSPDKNKDQ